MNPRIAGCCARAASGHAAADPAIPVMKSRRRIAFPRPRTSPSRSLCQLTPAADITSQMLTAAWCRYCCKSLFALLVKNFPGCRRDFPVKMWGTSSPDDKLADDLGNAIEGTRISDRRSDFFTTGKFETGNLGLLQQYLPIADLSRCSNLR